MVNYCPAKILEYLRDGLIEQEHFGFLIKMSSNGNVQKVGDDKNYPFFMRSCMKPLIASLLIDFKLDEFYNMTSKEIAVGCASHAGEPCHVNIVKGFLDKIELDESYLKCSLHKPLSKTEQNKLILTSEKENILQNNCSGKHAIMLGICKKMGWGVNEYYEREYPLQVAIRDKIYQLCEIEINYPETKDGCGVPIYSMPLENMVKGYLNLFLNEKYSKIRDAFVQNPYLIGGEDRFDTAIMTAASTSHLSPLTSNLIAKSGAGGLCIVVNLQQKKGLIIKVMDCDMKARAICLIEALKQLGWLNEKMLENDLIKAQNRTDILTLHGEKIGQAKTCFTLS